jgi:hypothetical protein
MRASFEASWLVVVDESMVKWTSRRTLPNWVFVPRKPTPAGQEWHTLACALTKIIISMDPVESTSTRRHDSIGKMAGTVLRLTEDAGLHGCPRVLVGDSAFPTLRLMQSLHSHKIFSIFAIKKKSNWPKGMNGESIIKALKNAPLGSIRSQVLTSDSGFKYYLCGIRDMNTCLLSSNAGSAQYAGDSVKRTVTSTTGQRNTVTFLRTDVHDLFYSARHGIDDNNNIRQNTRELADTWQSKDWRHRSFAMLLGVAEANAYLAYKYFVPNPTFDGHVDFRRQLIRELLDVPELIEDTSKDIRNHKLMTFPANRKHDGVSWVIATCGTYPQRKCKSCHDYKKVRTYCECDPTSGLCNECHFEHLCEL